uniref:Plastocyanin-like domain-containing protein n=1 Tax=Globodera pallida TaxID=36090 RepID=A0A183CTB9_GLOPA
MFFHSHVYRLHIDSGRSIAFAMKIDFPVPNEPSTVQNGFSAAFSESVASSNPFSITLSSVYGTKVWFLFSSTS